jgi:hypothetical protein
MAQEEDSWRHTREKRAAKCVQALVPLMTGPHHFSILACIQAIPWDHSLLTIGNTGKMGPTRNDNWEVLSFDGKASKDRCIGLRGRLRNVIT